MNLQVFRCSIGRILGFHADLLEMEKNLSLSEVDRSRKAASPEVEAEVINFVHYAQSHSYPLTKS